MVTVFLRGGLGNQMFQYAAGFALARRNNAPLALDTTFLNDRTPRRQFTYRTYDLDVFTVEPRFTSLSKASSRAPIPGVWLGLDLTGIAARNALGTQKLIKENEAQGFDPEVLHAKGDVLLWGRWQNPRYFEDAAEELREREFRFRIPLEGGAKTLGEEISATNSVGIHVRRGDYLLPVGQALYGATDLAYYERAVAYMAGKVSNPHFYVFSDDQAWCRENLKLSAGPMTFVDDSSAGPKSSFHLRLMSLCKHNIIANSTFSWWGAWLNRNPEKIVVAPGKWMINGANGQGIVPEAWVRV